MDPLWLILVVNVIALFAVPFLTYHFAHKNNLNILKERWICELRNAATELVEACEKLYSANDTLYSSISGSKIITEELRKELQKYRDEAQTHVTGANTKLRLLFKDGDESYLEMEKSIKNFLSSVDEFTKTGDMIHMKIERKNTAQQEYLLKINILLHQRWNEITK